MIDDEDEHPQPPDNRLRDVVIAFLLWVIVCTVIAMCASLLERAPC